MLLKRQIGLVGATEVRVHYTFDGIARTVEGSVAKGDPDGHACRRYLEQPGRLGEPTALGADRVRRTRTRIRWPRSRPMTPVQS